ncbi:MAG: exodeoxyribonuclease VII large subunit [Ilumatobacteraceae bacterium]
MSQPAFDFGEAELDDPTNPTYTVGELAEAINAQLRRGFDQGVWVLGEIDGLTHRGPHTYFSLVERDGQTKAVVQVSLFAPMKRRLTPLLRKHRLELRDGMKVRIHGHLDFYAPNGRLGLKMAGLDPRYTLGEIAQSRDEIMRRLVAEGLIDANARVPLSPVPLRVGVVASVDSAAWHDFRAELERSRLGFEALLVDTRVQGELAVPMVVAAVRTLTRRDDIDVVVVIRGGGARNELAVFDAEPIARSIAASPVPVFTGLGHEIDRSVADEVAHTSLKTPTACAVALVERVNEAVGHSEAAWRSIVGLAGERSRRARTELHDTAHRIARHTHAAVERADERLGLRRQRLVALGPTALDRSGERLRARGERVLAAAAAGAMRESGRLDVLAARVDALDPAVQLARGWSITRRADGRVVRSINDLAGGEAITTSLADGDVSSVVERVQPRADTTESEPPS